MVQPAAPTCQSEHTSGAQDGLCRETNKGGKKT